MNILNNISVTANGQTSSNANIVLDGPYSLTVANDQTFTCKNCVTTVERDVTYQIQIFSKSYTAGTTQICEQPNPTEWSCGGNLNLSANYCPGTPGKTAKPSNSLPNGQFTDQWSLFSDGWPTGCGFSLTDTWNWLTPSNNSQELGILSGFVKTNAVEVNGVTSTLQNKQGLTNGTPIPR